MFHGTLLIMAQLTGGELNPLEIMDMIVND